jgi:hypothetical protein
MSFRTIQTKEQVYIKKIQVKKDMLIEICGGNISTADGLVNGADGLFKSSSTIDGKTYIWIEFFNL